MRSASTRTKRLAVALFATGAALVSSAAPAFEWADTWISYKYGTAFREPANPKDIAKNIVSFTHVDGYKYGGNFLNVDVLMSDSNDPANNGGGGAQELYLVFRTHLSLNKTTGINTKWGPIRDWSLQAGFDLNAKNDAFAPRVQKTFLGPRVDFDVPGVWYLAVEWKTEHNHNGLANPSLPGQTNDVSFDNNWGIETAWLIPFEAGIPMKFQGFLTYFGEKGKDGFGNPTKPETLFNAAIMLDVGSLFYKKDTIFLGVGYQYWNNKFGNDPQYAGSCQCGTRESLPMFQAEWHF